jgi:hypothetical protein
MSESLIEGEADGGSSEEISVGNGLATTDGFWLISTIEKRVGYCDGTWLGTIDGSSLHAYVGVDEGFVERVLVRGAIVGTLLCGARVGIIL